jgi:hypothetical protein
MQKMQGIHKPGNLRDKDSLECYVTDQRVIHMLEACKWLEAADGILKRQFDCRATEVIDMNAVIYRM